MSLPRPLWILGILGLLATLAAGVFLFFIWGERFEIVLDQAELQASIEKQFPREKQYLLLFNVTLKEPKVELLAESDRIQMELQVGLRVKGWEPEYLGFGVISGKLRYDPERGEFFLSEPEVERFMLPSVPEKFTAKANDVVSLALREWCERFPVYRLKEGKTNHDLAKLVLKGMAVRKGKLFLTLGVGP